MECYVIEKAVRFVEGMHAFIGVSIPDFHGFIVAAADDQSTVGRESGATHPVRMLIQWELKFLPVDCPNLDGFVFGRTEQTLTIAGEIHTSDSRRVGFEYRWFTFDTGNPQTDFFIFRSRSDQMTRWRERDRMHGILSSRSMTWASLGTRTYIVTDEAIGPYLWFEWPEKETGIQATRH
jgi:hypothetical protein